MDRFNKGNHLFCIHQHRTMRSWKRLLPIHCITVLATMVAAQSNLTGTPTMSPASVPTNGLESNRTCISNITEIETLMSNKSPFIEETYVICPNKTYVMFDGNNESDYRPIVPRSKSVFKCGEDGKSSNNCILTGGIFQIFSGAEEFPGENKVGIVFQGFTLVSGTITSAFLVAAGDHTFIDCIFQGHINDGVVKALFTVPEERRRLTESVPDAYSTVSQWKAFYNSLKNSQQIRDNGRGLQANEELTRQVVTFENCLFRDNAAGPETSTSLDGLITAFPSNDIVLKSCIFQNNSYAKPFKGENSYAVWVQGGKLSISDTCFINNNFAGAGVVIASNTTGSTFIETSNFGTQVDDVKCHFAEVGGECVDFSSTTCTSNIFTGIVPPNSGPVVVPTAAPIMINTATSDSIRVAFLPHLSLLLLTVALAAFL